MRYDVADFTKVIDIVYIIILHAVEKNFCNLPSSFKALIVQDADIQNIIHQVGSEGRISLDDFQRFMLNSDDII